MGVQATGAAVVASDVVSDVVDTRMVVEAGVGVVVGLGAGTGTGEPLLLSVFLKVPGAVKAHWLILPSKQDGPVMSCAMLPLNAFL